MSDVVLDPLDEKEVLALFECNLSISPHVPTIYGLARGVKARRIVDLGIGTTTRVLRLAAEWTGGTVFSCDCDRARFEPFLARQTDRWKLSLCASEKFLEALEPPIDFAVHDAAHDYNQVRLDLELLLPKMSTFGLVVVHDSQQPEVGADVLGAIADATEGRPVSLVTLPFGAGLTIIRVESGPHAPIEPRAGALSDGRPDTKLMPFATRSAVQGGDGADRSLFRWARWKARKLVRGY